MRKWIVYRAKFPDNRVYIGSTCAQIKTRISQHIHNANNSEHVSYNSKLSKAIREFGKVIKWEIIHQNLPQRIAHYVEALEVDAHNSFVDGYNSTDDGTGKAMPGELNKFYNKHHSESSKRKIKMRKFKNKTFKLGEVTRERMSISRQGERNPMFGKTRDKYVRLRVKLKNTRVFNIINEITGEVYQVFGISGICKFTKHHWNLSGKYFYNKKRWHCFKLEIL